VVVNTRNVEDLDKEIASLLAEGYRLDMIMPADSPREALMSRNREPIKLQNPQSEIPHPKSTGRAGMEYRDLIPDRLGGRLIASHIRITNAGPVPDYVHYHKIDFQMIYCKSGWVRVVYEDQGPPFVLEAGDCVLQPPEIRHRVLEASAGAEVIEVSSPAEHETWIEHDLELPTSLLNPDRSFGGQRFVRHIAKEAGWQVGGAGGVQSRDLGIATATNGSVDAKVIRTAGDARINLDANGPVFLFVLNGNSNLTNDNGEQRDLDTSDSLLIPADSSITIDASSGTELLQVAMLPL
jgi:quercetin dioxygenase-like cupin family protein